jgi:hypothetical protein
MWGTFNTVCTIIRGLPPGSQGATRDMAEAYRTVPLHYSQWPATVVRLSEDAFCIDTCTAFGMGPSAGVYGHVADAGVDLLQAQGLGLLIKWVDDHLFSASAQTFDSVKTMGRWSSNAFILYLRQHAVVLAPYLQDTPILEPFMRYAIPPPH